jgi:hypothetical protein
METEGSIPISQGHSTCSYPEPNRYNSLKNHTFKIKYAI